jgi:hypothetical protein
VARHLTHATRSRRSGIPAKKNAAEEKGRAKLAVFSAAYPYRRIDLRL